MSPTLFVRMIGGLMGEGGLRGGNAAERRTGAIAEEASGGDHRAARRVLDERAHRVARPEWGLESGIERAVGQQAREGVRGLAAGGTEVASDHDVPIHGLKGEGRDARRARAGNERRIERTVGIEARDVIPHLSADEREVAPGKHASVRQDREGEDAGRGAAGRGDRRGGEGEVEGAVRVQPRDVGSSLAVEGSEIAADERASVALHGERVHRHASDIRRAGVEREVRRAAREQTPHAAPGLLREKDAAVAEHEDGLRFVTRRRGGIAEEPIGRTVGVQARVGCIGRKHARADTPADQHTPIQLHGDGPAVEIRADRTLVAVKLGSALPSG